MLGAPAHAVDEALPFGLNACDVLGESPQVGRWWRYSDGGSTVVFEVTELKTPSAVVVRALRGGEVQVGTISCAIQPTADQSFQLDLPTGPYGTQLQRCSEQARVGAARNFVCEVQQSTIHSTAAEKQHVRVENIADIATPMGVMSGIRVTSRRGEGRPLRELWVPEIGLVQRGALVLTAFEPGG